MNREEITYAALTVGAARGQWTRAKQKFDETVAQVANVLVLEAVANRMSAQSIASLMGMTPKRVHKIAQSNGLSATKQRNLMSAKAADALASNADLLGIDPRDMDLTSPLAYLPMGSQLKEFLETRGVSQVHELSGTELAEGWWCESCELFERDDQISTQLRVCESCGCSGEDHLAVTVVVK